MAQAANIPDYSNTLVQLLKSHLLAVCERSWSDPECVQARAGFIVTQQSPFQVAFRHLRYLLPRLCEDSSNLLVDDGTMDFFVMPNKLFNQYDTVR